MTKADILDALPQLSVCNGYKIDGEEKSYVPFQMNKVLIEPMYQNFEGWQTDITSISDYDLLPEKMKNYVDYLNQFLKVPVKYISNGPGRDQIIVAR